MAVVYPSLTEKSELVHKFGLIQSSVLKVSQNVSLLVIKMSFCEVKPVVVVVVVLL